jgi:hypothetical protein
VTIKASPELLKLLKRQAEDMADIVALDYACPKDWAMPDLSTDEKRAAFRARCQALALHFGPPVFSKNRPERTWTTEE